MADIRIKDLPLEVVPSGSEKLALDGSSTRSATITAVVEAGRPTASQAEAEAGVQSTKAMTPLTTKQAIEAQAVAISAIGSTIQPFSANLTELAVVDPGTAGMALLATGPVSDAQTLLDIATKTIYDPSNFALPIRFKNGNFSMPPVPNNLVLYVMKTGNDTVTNDLSKGSTTGTAFLTIDAALNFAKKYWEFDGRMTVLELRIGAGSWGNFATGSSLKQGYDSYPFAIFLVAQDAATPANWPIFDIISIGGFINKGVYVENVTAGTFGVTRFNILCVNNVRVAPPVVTATVTMTVASPCVVTWTGHDRVNGDPIKFSTTGALPTGLAAGTTYYVVGAATNTFNVAATVGGAAINTSGTQSGVHTARAPNFTPYCFYASLKAQLHVFGDINITEAVSYTSAFIYAQQQGSIGLENGDAPATFPMFNLINAGSITSPYKYRTVYDGFIYSPVNVYPQLTYAANYWVDASSLSVQTLSGVDLGKNAASGGPVVVVSGNTAAGYRIHADGYCVQWGNFAMGTVAASTVANDNATVTLPITLISGSYLVERSWNNPNLLVTTGSASTTTSFFFSARNFSASGQAATVRWRAEGYVA